MKSRVHTLLAAAAAFFLLAGSTHAQVQGTAVGPKLGFYLQGGNFMVGGIAVFPITPEIDLEPGVEYVFGVLNSTVLVVDGNAKLSFPLRGLTVRPFVMGGLGLVLTRYSLNGVSSSQTDARLNISGGAIWNSRDLIQYWTGLKIVFLGKADSDVLLQSGVNFYL